APEACGRAPNSVLASRGVVAVKVRSIMPDRRRVLETGLAAVGSLAFAAPAVLAQRKPIVKVRYNEVVRSILYTPVYVAIAKGLFEEAGIEQTLSTANGGDKSVAALLSNSAD